MVCAEVHAAASIASPESDEVGTGKPGSPCRPWRVSLSGCSGVIGRDVGIHVEIAALTTNPAIGKEKTFTLKSAAFQDGC